MVKKPFGCTCNEIRLGKAEKVKWIDRGWLGRDGICQFPEEVQATLSGVKLVGLPPKFWDNADDQKILYGINSGAIRFVDGNGNAMTKQQYMARYPDYPDPSIVAQLKGLLPPNRKGFINIL